MGNGRVVLAGAVLLASCSGRAPKTALRPPPPTTVATTVPETTTATTVAGGCPPAPARVSPRQDRPRYQLHVAVDPVKGTASGDVSVQFTPDLATDRLVFRLWPNSPNMARAGARLDAGPQVVVDGTAVTASRPDPTTLVAVVPSALVAGRTVVVQLAWRLVAASPVPERVSHVADSIRLGSFFPILAWEPGAGWMTEPPTTAHGEAAGSPAADFDLTVTVPAGFDVLASGVPSGPGHWLAQAVPDLGLSVGHFAEQSATVDSVAVTVGVDRAVAGESPTPYLTKALAVIASYGRRFGPYPWPVYTIAVTPGLTGGIEYPMHTMQGPGSIGRSTSHEIGHQYFYALVTDDQARDPWLDEGLATWAEAGYEGSLGAMRARVIPPEGRGHAGAPMTYWDARSVAYYPSAYVQPTQALAALGPPDLVDCALRLYVARNAYRIARPGDLIAALTAVFPKAAAVLARYGLHA